MICCPRSTIRTIYWCNGQLFLLSWEKTEDWWATGHLKITLPTSWVDWEESDDYYINNMIKRKGRWFVALTGKFHVLCFQTLGKPSLEFSSSCWSLTVCEKDSARLLQPFLSYRKYVPDHMLPTVPTGQLFRCRSAIQKVGLHLHSIQSCLFQVVKKKRNPDPDLPPFGCRPSRFKMQLSAAALTKQETDIRAPFSHGRPQSKNSEVHQVQWSPIWSGGLTLGFSKLVWLTSLTILFQMAWAQKPVALAVEHLAASENACQGNQRRPPGTCLWPLLRLGKRLLTCSKNVWKASWFRAENQFWARFIAVLHVIFRKCTSTRIPSPAGLWRCFAGFICPIIVGMFLNGFGQNTILHVLERIGLSKLSFWHGCLTFWSAVPMNISTDLAYMYNAR